MATVALTAAVGMLADSSHREAETNTDDTPEAVPTSDKPTLVRRDSGRSAYEDSSGDYFGDSGGTFGAPMMRPVQSGGSIALQRVPHGGFHHPVAGYSQDYLESLSDEEYEALVEGLREAGMLDPARRATQLAALERASAARAGKARRD